MQETGSGSSARGCDGCRAATRHDLTELTLPNEITAAPWGLCVCQGEKGRFIK